MIHYTKFLCKNKDADWITFVHGAGEPFLSIEDKLVFLLALTSNIGSNDFQELNLDNNNKLYQKVIETSRTWKNSSRIMYVVGAKNTKEIRKIRDMVPDSYLLIPGVGAQGGAKT